MTKDKLDEAYWRDIDQDDIDDAELAMAKIGDTCPYCMGPAIMTVEDISSQWRAREMTETQIRFDPERFEHDGDCEVFNLDIVEEERENVCPECGVPIPGDHEKGCSVGRLRKLSGI